MTEKQFRARMAGLSDRIRCRECRKPERDAIGPVAGKVTDGLCLLCSLASAALKAVTR